MVLTLLYIYRILENLFPYALTLSLLAKGVKWKLAEEYPSLCFLLLGKYPGLDLIPLTQKLPNITVS